MQAMHKKTHPYLLADNIFLAEGFVGKALLMSCRWSLKVLYPVGCIIDYYSQGLHSLRPRCVVKIKTKASLKNGNRNYVRIRINDFDKQGISQSDIFQGTETSPAQ